MKVPEPANHARFSGRRDLRLFGQGKQGGFVEACSKALQPLRRDLPVGVAAGPCQQVNLACKAVRERAAQLGGERRIVSGRGGERRIKGACFIDHSPKHSVRGLNRGYDRRVPWYRWRMTGGSRIVAFGPGGDTPQPADETFHAAGSDAASDELWLEEAESQPFNPAREWLAPALALGAIALWTGFFGWAMWSRFSAGITPGDGVALIGNWALPVLLICTI